MSERWIDRLCRLFGYEPLPPPNDFDLLMREMSLLEFGGQPPTELEKNGRILRTIHEPPSEEDWSLALKRSNLIMRRRRILKEVDAYTKTKR